MTKFFGKILFYISSLAACAVISMSTGCASGGYKTTRSLAQWLNSQQIIIRIILYILGAFVFAITMLIDLVLFNTMDFWNGRVSSGNYEFKDGDKTFYVEHSYQPGTTLRHSKIRVFGKDKTLIQDIALIELPNNEIEMHVDGKKRAQVTNIDSLPVVTAFDRIGKVIEQKILFPMGPETAIARK